MDFLDRENIRAAVNPDEISHLGSDMERFRSDISEITEKVRADLSVLVDQYGVPVIVGLAIVDFGVHYAALCYGGEKLADDNGFYAGLSYSVWAVASSFYMIPVYLGIAKKIRNVLSFSSDEEENSD